MEAINCTEVTKLFRTYQKRPGVAGAVRSFWRREYRDNPAVKKFSLQIKRGELVGLLGPNGAGKTTLMKMLTGIIVPSSGSMSVLGFDPWRRQQDFRKRIALVMGQKSQLWWDIPAMDSFLLLQRYYEIDNARFKKRLDELTGLLGVTSLLNVHVRKLSLGERMKMELISCLLHDPEVIFLDEPTIGLDLVAQRNVREFIARYQRDTGTTIILTPHYMADVDALCDRIVLILSGSKRFDGSIGSFAQILGREKFVTVRFDKAVDRDHELWDGLFPTWNDESTRVDLRVDEGRLRNLGAAIFQQFPVNEFATEKMPIERVMETLMQRPDLLPEA